MKNLNLENYNVAEMDAAEMKSVDGGIIPVIVILVGVCFLAAGFIIGLAD